MMKFDFSKKTAIVIGGSRGIGGAIAQKLLDCNCNVIITSTKIIPEWCKKYRNCDPKLLDYLNDTSVITFFEEVRKLRNIEIIINNAGIQIPQPIYNINYDDWDKVMKVNLYGPMQILSVLTPKMKSAKYGRIINMSSILSEGSVVGTSAYTASKAGLNAAIKVIAKENAKHNILINNLNLGYFDLGMTLKINNYAKLKNQIPVERFGEIEEIVRAIEFLRNSNYITGTTINISGGLW